MYFMMRIFNSFFNIFALHMCYQCWGANEILCKNSSEDTGTRWTAILLTQDIFTFFNFHIYFSSCIVFLAAEFYHIVRNCLCYNPLC
jgi:hypothetical protein